VGKNVEEKLSVVRFKERRRVGGKEGPGSLATQSFEVGILLATKEDGTIRELETSSGKRELESEGSQEGGLCMAGAEPRTQPA
jgi:hypothetical protein